SDAAGPVPEGPAVSSSPPHAASSPTRATAAARAARGLRCTGVVPPCLVEGGSSTPGGPAVRTWPFLEAGSSRHRQATWLALGAEAARGTTVAGQRRSRTGFAAAGRRRHRTPRPRVPPTGAALVAWPGWTR